MYGYVKKKCKNTFASFFVLLKRQWVDEDKPYQMNARPKTGDYNLNCNVKDWSGRPIGGLRKYCKSNDIEFDSALVLNIPQDCSTMKSKREGIFLKADEGRPFLCKRCGIYGSETCNEGRK